MIDVTPLRRALATLDTALAARALAADDPLIRDACIQRFEYSYELVHKFLRRYLEATEQADVAEMSFPTVIRLGFERGLLLESWDVWIKFREARNATSHGYDEVKAIAVASKIPAFAEAAHFLLSQIEARQQ